jgi:hypothetical protein
VPSANDTLYAAGGNMSFNPYNGAKQMPLGNNDTRMSQNDFFQAFLQKNEE